MNHVIHYAKLHIWSIIGILLLLVFAHIVSLGLVTVALRFTRVAAVLCNFIADANTCDANRWIEKTTNAHAPTGRLSKVWLLLCCLVEVSIFRVVILVSHVLLLLSILLVLRLKLILQNYPFFPDGDFLMLLVLA